VEEIKTLYKQGQPVLVGTISIEKSEVLSAYLKRHGVPHNVLNAKHHEHEAEIVAQAGRKGAVTISTNMAGRGTDILLGGNPEFLARKACKLGVSDPEYPAQLEKARQQQAAEHDAVVALGGLHILGTERHEARRIDNQLRGRAGRQGDPGSSRFYLSLEDDLLRIFGSERISGIMEKLGMEEGQPIEHSMITRAIENAQRKVEAHNFDIRKHLLEYDDVMNKQREAIYSQRREMLESEDIHAVVQDMATEVLEGIWEAHVPADAEADDWQLEGLTEAVWRQYGVHIPLTPERIAGWSRDALYDHLRTTLLGHYTAKLHEIGDEQFQALERWMVLQVIDKHWKDHLLAMDYLKEGIGLRGYGQKNPLNEYKREGFELFMGMMERIKADATESLSKVQLAGPADSAPPPPRPRPQQAVAHRGTFLPGEGDEPVIKPVRRQGEKVGRNAPCPCGSGKKYKRCCGA
jgi:preprotein translocase subunit SecA